MIIVFNKTTIPDIPHIIFSLETKDFIEEVGHKFITELKYSLKGEYVIEEFMGKLVWMFDIEYIDEFIECYQKYFKIEDQKVKII